MGAWLQLPYAEWQWKMNALYTAYSFPNLIVPLIGGRSIPEFSILHFDLLLSLNHTGVLVDAFGSTKTIVIFGSLTCLGQALFAYGVSQRTYWLMSMGRALFGVGGESLEVAQSRVTTEWFRHGYLGLALGLNLTFARLASALNDVVSPWIASKLNAAIACWFGVAICGCSLMSGLILDEKRRALKADGLEP